MKLSCNLEGTFKCYIENFEVNKNLSKRVTSAGLETQPPQLRFWLHCEFDALFSTIMNVGF